VPKDIGSRVFRNSENWPEIPPWWCLPSSMVAELLRVTSACLIRWRMFGQGPAFVPPIHLRPAQGNAYFYRLCHVRAWAASKVGIDYPTEDQMDDFLRDHFPAVYDPAQRIGAARWFDSVLSKDRAMLSRGTAPKWLPEEKIMMLDQYHLRQPKWINRENKYELVFSEIDPSGY